MSRRGDEEREGGGGKEQPRRLMAAWLIGAVLMYNTMGWGLEYLLISVLRYIYELNKEHKP